MVKNNHLWVETMRLTTLLITTLFLLQPCLSTADQDDAEKPDADAKEVPEAQSFVSRHEIRIDGQRIKYTATAATLLMRDKEDEPIALIGYTAYVKEGGNQAERPLMFAWNGGPGSASLWLHMGVLGPQRAVIEDLVMQGKGPFRRVSNEFSILDRVDLVMVDPVGTGYSRAVGEAEGKDFWGVDNDIESVSQFIIRYLTDNGRWASPKYILGESYGGIRAGGVSYKLLSKYNVGLNGVVLVSPYMDVAGGGGVGIGQLSVGYAMTLSGYAATAWYHDALADKPADFKAFLAEVDQFAVDEYLPVLVKGRRASDTERMAVAKQLGAYTGTTADYWLAANFRVKESQFLQELVRKRGQVAGRIDSRIVGYTTNPLSESMPYDPFFSTVGPTFVAAFHDYYRNDLGVVMGREYVVSGGLYKDWDRSHQGPSSPYRSPAADTGIDLAYAMIQNPTMKVLVQQGYYDLATPYRATEHFIDQLNVPDTLRGNVSIEYYEAGHMMYVHPPSLAKYKQDLGAFIDASH
jgi:carboxypeptidase C (cathepsin A)